MRKTDTSFVDTVVVPILGMHRSGTSMFARALNLLGLELGEPLMPPQPDNPKGFWENEFFWALDIQLLRGFGKHPSGYGDAKALSEIPGLSAALTPSGEELDAIGEHLKGAFHTDRWGWKDPRSVLLFPFWLDALVQLGYRDIRPAIIVRHPSSCIASIAGRGDVELQASHLGLNPADLAADMWKTYHRILTAISDETAGLVAVHDWFLDQDKAESELRRCAEYCGLDGGDVKPALKWMDPSAVHHRIDADGADAESQALYWELVARAESQRKEWLGTGAAHSVEV